MLLLAAVTPFNPTEYKKQIEDWRAKRYERLRSEEGWLTLIGLFWLQEGDNNFGSAATN
jgi:hypothetical protein